VAIHRCFSKEHETAPTDESDHRKFYQLHRTSVRSEQETSGRVSRPMAVTATFSKRRHVKP